MDKDLLRNFPALLKDILEVRSKEELLQAFELGEDEFNRLLDGSEQPTHSLSEKILLYILQSEDLKGLLIQHGGIPGAVLPAYNIYQPFDFQNLPVGHNQIIRKRTLINRPTKIGGLDVNFPFGVSASVLMGTSEFVRFYSRRGFDILTYKTVRTKAVPVHKFPNWAFIARTKKIKVTRSGEGTEPQVAVGPDYWPSDKRNITMANSFGVPSLPPEEWEADIRAARALIRPGQILIVSVMATTDKSEEDIAQDYADAAVRAKNAGAQIIELNLSCPNVPGETAGQIYRTPSTTAYVSKVVHDALAQSGEKIPLFIKIGYLEKAPLTELVKQAAEYIDGIVAINTISSTIVDGSGQPYFPDDMEKEVPRKTAGVSGAAIRSFAHEVITNLVNLKKENSGYHFDILAAGGVQSKKDVAEYLQLGATGVLSCTGAMMNPWLAIETRNYDGIPEVDPALLTTIGGEEEEKKIMSEKRKGSSLKEVEPGVYEFSESDQELSEEFVLSVLKKGLSKNLFQLVQLSQQLQAGEVSVEQAKKELSKLHS
jgi:dihydroorotate dehydrogenase